jgi:hypothetical protein
LFVRQGLKMVCKQGKTWLEKGAQFPSDRGKSYDLGLRISLILVSNTIKYIILDISLIKIYSRKVREAATRD